MSDESQRAYQEACERFARRCAEERAEKEAEEFSRCEKTQRHRSNGALVYKTFETPAQPSEPATDWSVLNAWLQMNVENALDLFSEAVVKYVAEDRRSMREELGSLKAEVEVLRGIVKSNNVELIKRSKNVA